MSNRDKMVWRSLVILSAVVLMFSRMCSVSSDAAHSVCDDDVVFILRPTSPLRDKDFIRSAWENFKKSGDQYDSMRAVAEVDQHPGKMWSIVDGDLMPLFPFSLNDVPWHSNQSAILPKVYKQTASLEIVWVSTIKQKNSLSGTRIMPLICDGKNAFDINSQDDLNMAKYWLDDENINF